MSKVIHERSARHLLATMVLAITAVALTATRAASAVGGSGFTSVNPARLLDTRRDGSTVDGLAVAGGRLLVGATLSLPINGRGGIPSNAEAVMLNVTAVGPDASGYLTVYPCGAARPLASNLNFQRGDIVPNAVFAKVGDNGRVCIYTSATTDVVIDANGYSTSFDAGAWSYPAAGYWEYDGDRNGAPEEAWLANDADAPSDVFAFDVDNNGSLDWVATDLINSPAIDAWFDVRRHYGQMLYVDPDEDGRYQLHLYDEQRDGYAEFVFGDIDQNGLYEAVLYDPGRDGMFEWRKRDTDGDGVADSWVTLTQPPPPGPSTPALTLADAFNRIAIDIVTGQVQYTGGPTLLGAGLFPSFPTGVY